MRKTRLFGLQYSYSAFVRTSLNFYVNPRLLYLTVNIYGKILRFVYVLHVPFKLRITAYNLLYRLSRNAYGSRKTAVVLT